MNSRKFKVGDIIYKPGFPEHKYKVEFLDNGVNQNYVGTDENGATILVPFSDEPHWLYYGHYSPCDVKQEMPLSERYETLANDYLYEFVKQTGIEEDAPFWVGGEVAGIACVADYFVDYATIRYVVDGKMSFEDFDEWYNYCIDVKMIDGSLFTPTLEQWCYGEFTRISDERLEKMKKLKKDFEQLVQEEKEKQNE